ncbi:hypothetical protein FA13DRAFT_543116 [Coprinellus micaceus]|uniref:Uncharacterized protein n=1 Tax=Coprinellus micaceus TaxID=71717 RepID=A0A4Y7T809_COPMI|nr:hypothetical protein FA13DRAFT_543116 [Coprinellus micaceus]
MPEATTTHPSSRPSIILGPSIRSPHTTHHSSSRAAKGVDRFRVLALLFCNRGATRSFGACTLDTLSSAISVALSVSLCGFVAFEGASQRRPV